MSTLDAHPDVVCRSARPGPRGTIEPSTQLTIALLVSLVLWAPAGMAALDGQLELTGAGLRYLVAFLGCRFAIGGIAHLIDSYHGAQRDDGGHRDGEPADRRVRRREDDVTDAAHEADPAED